MDLVSFRIPADLKEALEKQAADLDRSVSWVIRNALIVYAQGLKERQNG